MKKQLSLDQLYKDNRSSESENRQISPTSEGIISRPSSEHGGVDLASASTYRVNLEPELFHDDGIHEQPLIYREIPFLLLSLLCDFLTKTQ